MTERRRNPEEPLGHRGHPTDAEVRRAKKLAVYLERAVRILEAQGFSQGDLTR